MILIVQLASLTNFLQNEVKPSRISVISQAVLQSAAQAQHVVPLGGSVDKRQFHFDQSESQ